MSENNNEVFASPENFHAKLAEIRESENNTADAPTNEEPEVENDVDNEPEQENDTANDEFESDEAEQEIEDSEEDDEPIDPKKPNFIPKSRFNKEIEKRKALEAQLKEERESRLKYESQLEMFNAMQKEQENKAKEPEYDPYADFDPLDPDAYNLTNKKIAELERKLEQFNNEYSTKTKSLESQQILKAQEQQFKESNPDFQEALNYLQQAEMAAAQNLYAPEDAQQYVAQRLNDALWTSLNNGKNAAEVMYKMAQSYGYKPESKTVAKKQHTNLTAINNNMKKNGSINNVNNAGSLGGAPKLPDINYVLKDQSNPNSGTDPKKFHELLERIKRSNR